MKIGNLSLINNVVLAPMAGITNLPFRMLVRNFGCSLAFTEMISSVGLVRETEKSYRYLDSAPGDKPLGVQIFGSDPVILAEAVQIAMDRGADLLDMNMGCPVKKVVKTGEQAAHLTRQMLAYSGRGRFLLETLNVSALVRDIIELVRPAIPKKVALNLELAEGLASIEADRGQNHPDQNRHQRQSKRHRKW